MKVIQPIAITGAVLVTSNVSEADAPAWAVGTTYGVGARVILAATHRIYESAVASNVGNDPAASTGKWLNIAPTNRWAMFDQSVGSATIATGSIAVVLAPPTPISAIGVVEARGASVRVQVTKGVQLLYDQTQPLGARTTAAFLDLPSVAGVQIFVTVTGATGASQVSVGALVAGTVLDLGDTGSSPTIGINDFSKRSTDDFGVTTVVQRDFANIMSLRTQLATSMIAEVQRRMAAMRAKPALWIGDPSFDSLAIYGFWKSFSVDLATTSVAYCSLSIEGLA